MLLLMLWDKKLAVYYFLGVVLMAYFKLPLIAIAAIAAILAVITAQRHISQRKSNVQTNNATENVDQSSSNLSQEE